MKRWLHHHRYALLVALRRLLAQPFSTLANVLVISLSLVVPILAAAVLVSAQPIVREIPVSPELTLFLHTRVETAQAQTLAEKIRADSTDIVSVRVVSRHDALQKLQDNPAWNEALAALPDNPLPDALIVTLGQSEQLASLASALADRWKQLPEVESIQLDSDWVRRLEAILRFIRAGLGLLATAVAVVVLATIFNTVRMQALTQREEIAVARLVGATEAFVRRPFLYLGAVTGALSCAVAISMAALALYPLNGALARLGQSYGTHIQIQLPDALSLVLTTVVVAILAALSARWSVTRNTRF
ncbi:MAG: ABC transporter permease [Alcaligenaceae bacterium]|nr:ABC transporter permease [Alcaligenaceae bacterium]